MADIAPTVTPIKCICGKTVGTSTTDSPPHPRIKAVAAACDKCAPMVVDKIREQRRKS